jgi:tRNA(Arg) A34 adenosine deaminase TadA
MKDYKQAMQLAIDEALKGIEQGQAPFGCVLIKDGKLIARAHNTVWQARDPIAHAEINAIRLACAQLGTIDLSGVEMFCTCEPCPMCYSAAHWAKISRIIFGARIEDARNAGFNELPIPAEMLNKLNPKSIDIITEFYADECRQIFDIWKQKGLSSPY